MYISQPAICTKPTWQKTHVKNTVATPIVEKGRTTVRNADTVTQFKHHPLNGTVSCRRFWPADLWAAGHCCSRWCEGRKAMFDAAMFSGRGTPQHTQPPQVAQFLRCSAAAACAPRELQQPPSDPHPSPPTPRPLTRATGGCGVPAHVHHVRLPR